MFRIRRQFLTLAVVGLAAACGGGSSTPDTPAPAPGPDDWPLEVVNQASAPFELFLMGPGGQRTSRVGRVHTRDSATFNVRFQEWGIRILLIHESQNRQFTSNGVRAPKGTPLLLTIDPDMDAVITVNPSG